MGKFFSTSAWYFALLSAIFFLPFLGGVHLFDWDEINFAEIAREMIVTGNYLEPHIDYEVFTEKPPLFFWLQSGAMNLFGVGEYAARFPNALFGIFSLLLIYLIGARIHTPRFGFFWALFYIGSTLPHLYFKSGIIDPVFNFFIFLGIYGLILHSWKKTPVNSVSLSKSSTYYLLMAGLGTGLAILTKGPAAFIITALVLGVVFISKRFTFFISPLNFIVYCAITLGVTGVWYGIDFIVNGPTFFIEFTLRQWALFSTPDAGHGGFPGYHFVVLLVGCFPASVFALKSLFSKEKDPEKKDMTLWMKSLFWVVLILFTIVKSKIVHYSSMAYFPLTYLAASTVMSWIEGRIEWKRWMSITLGVIGSLGILVTAILPQLGRDIETLRPLMKNDPFAAANLDAEVIWTGWESLVALSLTLGFIMFFKLKKTAPNRAVKWLAFSNALWVQLTLIFFIAKIEGYSQRAHIEFWEDQVGKDVYVTTYGFKSYAPLWYARVMPHDNENYPDKDWMYEGDIDKPVLLSCKINQVEEFRAKYPEFEELYNKNGFYFFIRKPQ
ncbi:MAG: phospholipid carrier-dependent glycosyltransferase [Schleiferiaceae bacterium]